MNSVDVRIGQFNPILGDLEYNKKQIEAISRMGGADLCVFPELATTGYPPEDLLFDTEFVAAANTNITTGVPSIYGTIVPSVTATPGLDSRPRIAHNAAVITGLGDDIVYVKRRLPNYGPFDEARYFTPGTQPPTLFELNGMVFAVLVCEDAWDKEIFGNAAAFADVIVTINASPWHAGKTEEKIGQFKDLCRRTKTALLYVNCFGGQDELIFEGGSFVIDSTGDKIFVAKLFEKDVSLIRFILSSTGEVNVNSQKMFAVGTNQVDTGIDSIYKALVLGLKDYCGKQGFGKVIIGLSGGIDSALTAAIAADALGPSNVLGVAMPSPFSSDHSVADAQGLATNLGIKYKQIDITSVFETLQTDIGSHVDDDPGVAWENAQARIRGMILMTLSNANGGIVLATGNKSEYAVGYSTLYGDMAGGFAPIKDIPKTLVYRLAQYVNNKTVRIPVGSITKPPSAELAPDQLDSDSLPDYDVLDPMLEAFVERDEEPRGTPKDIEFVKARVRGNEFKRRQAPIGLRVTSRAMGRDRRYPIVNRWGKDQQ